MKIALVHDYLIKFGGAERVLVALHELYPDAPVYTLLFDPKILERFPDFKSWDIRTSFLQKAPWVLSKTDYYRALMPLATEQLDLSCFDVVLSDSHSFVKGVITKPDTIHINYCYTPTRYLWHQSGEAKKHLGFLARKFLPYGLNYLRVWDCLAADRVDFFIAISVNVQKRIKKFYRRDSIVIHPPVNCEKFLVLPESQIEDYFMVLGRLELHKAVDVVIRAFNDIKLPLKVVGSGEELQTLRKIANSNIEFLPNLDDNEVAKMLSRCRALICAQEEDFGIVAVEAMAAGRPVIAYEAGGFTETVIDGTTGVFFKEQSTDDLISCLRHFDVLKFNSDKISKHAQKFNKEIFQGKIRQIVKKLTS